MIRASSSECVDAVACADRNDCASDPALGGARCYCGSASAHECADSGPRPDAPCRREWERATRTTINAEVQNRFTDLAFPAGWAYLLLDCSRTSCADACPGSDTDCGNGTCVAAGFGPAACYCGSEPPDRCEINGPAPDAACRDEWQAATRSASNPDVQARLADLAFPAGWAYLLLQCELDFCAPACGH